MKNFYILVLFFGLCILIRLQLIASDCVIRLPTEVEITPIYAKKLGKYTIYLPYNGKDLHLREGETISGFCRTNFTSITIEEKINDYNYYDDRKMVLHDKSNIIINCIAGNLRYRKSIIEESVLSCNKLDWTVYDTNEVYEWCEKNENAKTFLLATKSAIDDHILAGICFNLKEWSLQTITYNVSNSGYKYNKEMLRDITKANLKAFQSLGDELSSLKSNYFDFTNEELQQQLENLSLTNLWLNLANYELSSIIQGESYKNYFNEFLETLNIIWWRNLRLGNWNNFINTLENYAYKNSFQIYAGTSGSVKIPSKNSADNNILEIKWFDIKDVVFCPDICSQIPWLKEIAPSLRYTTAGIMFCCSPDFVRLTDFLHGFPLDVLVARSVRNQDNVLQIGNASDNFVNSTDLKKESTFEYQSSEEHTVPVYQNSEESTTEYQNSREFLFDE